MNLTVFCSPIYWGRPNQLTVLSRLMPSTLASGLENFMNEKETAVIGDGYGDRILGYQEHDWNVKIPLLAWFT